MIDFFKRLFRDKTSDSPVRDVAALAATVSVPAVHAVLTDVASRSHFGGSPNLPPDTPWPAKDGRRLGFLARLSLGEIHEAKRIDWLPISGALLFFYDMDEQPWGFDPKHRGGAAVIRVPELPQPISDDDASPDASFSSIPFRNIAFQPIEVVPGSDRDSVSAFGLSTKESDLLFELGEQPFRGKPKHQVAGLPAPVQGDDMELECQLVSNGLYCGDSRGYEDPRAEAIGANAANWKLLFQFDTDDELGVMWGDCGTLYYWVEDDAAREGNFRNVWLILQCH